jgi:hypothetical protein|tara:strand:+ start:3476 stop:3781 length:306 start_codon:yes stop_codon:yes gene_type:complete
MARKKAKRSNGSKPSNGRKLGATVKRWGIIRGPGKYAATQTGVRQMEKAVPLALGLVALAAITPALAGQISSSVAGIPVVGPVAGTLTNYGASLRSRTGLQ